MRCKGLKTSVKTAMLVAKNDKAYGCKGVIYRDSKWSTQRVQVLQEHKPVREPKPYYLGKKPDLNREPTAQIHPYLGTILSLCTGT